MFKEDCLGKVDELLRETDCGVSLDSVDRAHRMEKFLPMTLDCQDSL